jgi:hypothetical protein
MDKLSEKKRAKLNELKRKLLDGQHVQNRQLKTWLGDDALKEMEDDWESQKSIRDDLASPPAQIEEYKKRLQKLTLLHSRAEHYSHKKRNAAAEDMYHQSEALAEELIEYMHEILQTDQSLQIWFDRLPDENHRGLTPASLPQVINSRSRYNQGGGFSSAKQSKQEVKIGAVEQAISALDEPQVMDDDTAAHIARMRSVLKRQE